MAELIKVSAQSRSTAVAGAIAGVMREIFGEYHDPGIF